MRARKHKLVEFEGEMLFQRRDDDVPIFLLKPIHEIRRELEDKIESIKKSGTSSPQATSVLLDKRALGVPRGATPVSRTPSPESSKAGTPVREVKPTPAPAPASKPASAPAPAKPTETPKIQLSQAPEEATKPEVVENKPQEEIQVPKEAPQEAKAQQSTEAKAESKPAEVSIPESQAPVAQESNKTEEVPVAPTESKTDVNNNSNTILKQDDDLPTVVMEATAVYVRPANPTEGTTTVVIADTDVNSAVSSAPTETAATA